LKTLFGILSILCLAFGTPAFAGILYTDGATNGTSLGLFIDGPGASPYQQTISDGFIDTNSGTAGSLDVGLWVAAGETPTTLSWWLGTSAFGDEISSGSMAQVGYTFLMTTSGYDVYDVHVTGLSGDLVAGTTYWLTLGGANDSAGDQIVAWDFNSGPAGCQWAVSGTPQGDCGLAAPEGEAFTINSPEPGTVMLFGSGLLGLSLLLRRKTQR